MDRNFTFEKHINKLDKKGNVTFHTLKRCAKFKRPKQSTNIAEKGVES